MIEWALEVTNLTEYRDREVPRLSGGQRQAMALLMSTMTPIEFLILDEHTAALDPKTAELIMELTDKIVKEKNLTTVMVTHNLRYAVEYGNRLIMMHQGHCVMDKAGKDKEDTSIDEILTMFNEICIQTIAFHFENLRIIFPKPLEIQKEISRNCFLFCLSL